MRQGYKRKHLWIITKNFIKIAHSLAHLIKYVNRYFFKVTLSSILTTIFYQTEILILKALFFCYLLYRMQATSIIRAQNGVMCVFVHETHTRSSCSLSHQRCTVYSVQNTQADFPHTAALTESIYTMHSLTKPTGQLMCV